MDELVAGADAVGREAASNVFGLLLGTPPALATFGTLQALGPLRFFLAPFPTFFEILIRSVGSTCDVQTSFAGLQMFLHLLNFPA